MSAKDPEVWMWERARAMLDEADRVHRQFFQLGSPGSRRPSWEPPVDIFETATELWVQVALPGVPAERIQVVVEKRRLVVSGDSPLPEAFRKAAVHRLEIPHGRFERGVELPPGLYELAQSELVNGCLFLNLKKLDP